MGAAEPIVTDMLLSFPPGTLSAQTDSAELSGVTNGLLVRTIIAFGSRICGMPISTDVQFEQRIGAPPIVLLDATKFDSKHHARIVSCFVRKLCLIDGLQWGCLTNGSLILEIAYGASTGTTLKCAYEALQEHPQLFAAESRPVAKRAVATQ